MKIDAQVESGSAHLSERCGGRLMTGKKDRYSEFVT
jgi:hypothetical protein